MNRKPEVTIIVPAYNEEEAIGGVLNSLKNLDISCEVVLVDDASTDRTFDIANQMGVRVIRHLKRKGNGAAVKTGVRNASCDIVIIFDGDGQYLAEDIPRIYDGLHEADLVVGYRVKESQQLKLRRYGNLLLAKFASLLSKKQIPDLTCGLRGVRRDIMMKIIDLLPDSFSLPTTSTLVLINSGFQVRFIPVKMIQRHKNSYSKLHPIGNGIKFMIIIVKSILLCDPRKIFSFVSYCMFSISLLSYLLAIVIDSGGLLFVSISLFLVALAFYLAGLLIDRLFPFRRKIIGFRKVWGRR